MIEHAVEDIGRIAFRTLNRSPYHSMQTCADCPPY
jgi:hypothetical protein